MDVIGLSPGPVSNVGDRLSSAGRELAGLAGQTDFGGMSEPPRTAAALDLLAGEWSAGLAASGGAISMIGRITSVTAGLFELVDGK
jgi:hypothetical protein